MGVDPKSSLCNHALLARPFERSKVAQITRARAIHEYNAQSSRDPNRKVDLDPLIQSDPIDIYI